MFHLPVIRTVSDLARNARALIEQVRQRQEPVIIAQRGRDVAVLLPIELYRSLESQHRPLVASPRLVNPADAAKFRMQIAIVDPAVESSDADL